MPWPPTRSVDVCLLQVKLVLDQQQLANAKLTCDLNLAAKVQIYNNFIKILRNHSLLLLLLLL